MEKTDQEIKENNQKTTYYCGRRKHRDVIIHAQNMPVFLCRWHWILQSLAWFWCKHHVYEAIRSEEGMSTRATMPSLHYPPRRFHNVGFRKPTYARWRQQRHNPLPIDRYLQHF